jgi:hypothetical protein
MQSLPTDVEGSSERLVHRTSPEVSRYFQGIGTPVPNTVPCNKEKEEERQLPVDHALREGGKFKGLHASL